jgi:hypothetical protein
MIWLSVIPALALLTVLTERSRIPTRADRGSRLSLSAILCRKPILIPIPIEEITANGRIQ